MGGYEQGVQTRGTNKGYEQLGTNRAYEIGTHTHLALYIWMFVYQYVGHVVVHTHRCLCMFGV